jgi:hypothetical protein
LFTNPARNNDTQHPFEVNASRFRGCFYLLNVAAQDGRPAVSLRCGQGNLFPARLAKVQDLVLSFPIEITTTHILLIPPTPGAMRVYKETVLPMIAQHATKYGVGCDVRTHLCESPQDMLEELIGMGLKKESLPECVGGTWSYDNCTHWVDSLCLRQKKESVIQAQLQELG